MIKIKADSRKVVPGDIFVALKGISSDGHDYIDKAISNGATEIVAEHGSYGVKTTIVEDTTKYLENYLEEHYKNIIDEMTMISITGTNGKTTGAFIIYELLNKLGLKCAYVGSIGYYLDKFKHYLPNTTPDLCSIYEYIVDAYDKGFKYFIVEGSSQGIDMGRFNTLRFDYIIYTNLTHEHLDYHKTMENYMEVKKRLFSFNKKNCVAIINSDDQYYKNFMLDHNENILYGKSDVADYKISDIECRLNDTSFILEANGVSNKLDSSLLGEYNVYNLIPALVILDKLGIPFDKYKDYVSTLSSPDGRNEKIEYKDNLVVVDYAHTPDGIEQIASSYRKVNPNHLYIVFGACGNRDRTKRPIMLDVATKYADKVIVTDYHLHGEDGNQIINDVIKGAKRDNFEVIRDRKKAIESGIDLLDSKDVLLILGKGHEKYLDIGPTTIPFDDREVSREYISKKMGKN